MSVPWYLMAKGKGGSSYKTASGPIVSVSDAQAVPLRSLVANIEPVQSGSGDPSPDNVRPISGWSAVNVWVKPTYDPTANPTATIQLGQTVYGGTLDVTNGVLTVDRWYLAKANASQIKYYFSATPPHVEMLLESGKFANAGTQLNAFSSMYQSTPGSANKRMRLYRTEIDIFDTDFTDQTATDAILADFIAVYKLQTPITIPLTATQISTLQGENNLWADSGDVTVEYLASGGTDPNLMKLAVAFMGRK